MDWVWEIYEGYIRKQLARDGLDAPTDTQLEAAFLKSLSASSVTVLVQEPWQNSVRFKGLERGTVAEKMNLLADPMTYLAERYGGGKFKLNFHEGWHFVATHNFKPEGAPRWQDAPAIDF